MLSGQAFHYRLSPRTPWLLFPALAGLGVAWVAAAGDVQRAVLFTTFALATRRSREGLHRPNGMTQAR